MYFDIKHQERYSRGELLLRTLLGGIYIAIPHGFLLMFVGLAGQVLSFISFWVLLFTGSYPQSFYEFQVKLIKWNMRVNASLFNLIDGYPEFGLSGDNENIELDVPYPENLSRGHALLKALFGAFYCALPHVLVLYFRILGTAIVSFIAFWVVLFTGEYPRGMFNFQVGTLRWSLRLNLYLGFLTDKYPPFSGAILDDEMPPSQGSLHVTGENTAE
jgi:hypothetical protein